MSDKLKEAFEVLLNIPSVKVEKVEVDREGNYRITVHSTEEGTLCHKCGKPIHKPYGLGELITLRYLPILGKQVYIRIRPSRYQCSDCDGNPTTTQRAPWYELRPTTSDARV